MMKTLFALPFDQSFESKKLCSYTLKPKDIDTFQSAIDNDYYFEFIYGDICVIHIHMYTYIQTIVCVYNYIYECA